MARASRQSDLLPVTLKQRWMLGQAEDPTCPDDLRNRWILSQALLVQPSIDMRRLRRAIGKVFLRHDSLRTRFCRVGGAWRVRIDPPGGADIHEIDLGTCDDTTFRREISAIVNRPMPLEESELAEITVVKCGARGDVLVTRIHHTITDGYGMIILVEDLVKLLIGLPIPGKAVSFETYLRDYHSPPPARAARNAAFWRELHRDFPTAPDVGRKAKGLEPLFDFVGELDGRDVAFTASQDSLNALEARARDAGVGPNTILMTAYLEALCAVYDLDKVMFMTHIARSEPGLETYMGDHTHDAYLPFEPAGKRPLTEHAKDLGGLLGRAMEHLPCDIMHRGSDYEAALFDRGCFPGQFCVHSPRAVIRQNRSAFSGSFHAPSGVPQRMGAFSVTRLDMRERDRLLAEMQLNLGEGQAWTGFRIEYDGIAYDRREIEKVGVRMAELLGLDLQAVAAA